MRAADRAERRATSRWRLRRAARLDRGSAAAGTGGCAAGQGRRHTRQHHPRSPLVVCYDTRRAIMSDQPQPYIARNPGDLISAEDWNDLQKKIRADIAKQVKDARDLITKEGVSRA